MAVDAFIYFVAKSADQQPNGETQDDTFKKKKAFEIKEFSFDIENPATIGSATTGAGSGKTKFNEFTIKKPTDSASLIFFKNACKGVHYPSVVLAVRKATGSVDDKQQPGPYLLFEFGTVFTTKIDWSGPGDEGPEEGITFAFSQLAIRYYPQDASGALKVAGKPMREIGWSVVTNAPMEKLSFLSLNPS